MRKKGLEWVGGFMSRGLLIYTACLALMLVVLCWQLGSLPLSSQESTTLASSKTLHQLINDPVWAPHKVFEYVLQHFNQAGRFRVRAVSIGFYVIFLSSFYYIVRGWFGAFSARLGVLLFGFTPLLLLMARSASEDIMYLFPLLTIACYMSLVRSKGDEGRKLALLSILIALSAYIPGGILFLIVGGFYGRQPLLEALGKVSRKIRASLTLLCLLLLAPLIYGCVKHPELIKTLLLVPGTLPSPADFLKWTGWSALALPWRSGLHNYFQIGKLAVLDGSQLILICFGVYALWDRAAAKTYTLAAVVVYAILETALNQTYTLLALSLPALMMFATAGLRYLHIEWNSVFPRNPLPRGLALFIMFAVVGLHVFWGLHYSLTAWPHSFGLSS